MFAIERLWVVDLSITHSFRSFPMLLQEPDSAAQ